MKRLLAALALLLLATPALAVCTVDGGACGSNEVCCSGLCYSSGTCAYVPTKNYFSGGPLKFENVPSQGPQAFVIDDLAQSCSRAFQFIATGDSAGSKVAIVCPVMTLGTQNKILFEFAGGPVSPPFAKGLRMYAGDPAYSGFTEIANATSTNVENLYVFPTTDVSAGDVNKVLAIDAYGGGAGDRAQLQWATLTGLGGTTGTGSGGFITKWDGALGVAGQTVLENSAMFDDGSRIGIQGTHNFSTTTGKEIRMADSDNTNYTGFKPPATGSLVTDPVYTMPVAFPGSNSVLQSTSAGVLSWITGGTVLGTGATDRLTYWTSSTTIDDLAIRADTNDISPTTDLSHALGSQTAERWLRVVTPSIYGGHDNDGTYSDDRLDFYTVNSGGSDKLILRLGAGALADTDVNWSSVDQMIYDNADLVSTEADGASAVAFKVGPSSTYSNTSARLLGVYNASLGTERLGVGARGGTKITSEPANTDQSLSSLNGQGVWVNQTIPSGVWSGTLAGYSLLLLSTGGGPSGTCVGGSAAGTTCQNNTPCTGGGYCGNGTGNYRGINISTSGTLDGVFSVFSLGGVNFQEAVGVVGNLGEFRGQDISLSFADRRSDSITGLRISMDTAQASAAITTNLINGIKIPAAPAGYYFSAPYQGIRVEDQSNLVSGSDNDSIAVEDDINIIQDKFLYATADIDTDVASRLSGIKVWDSTDSRMEFDVGTATLTAIRAGGQQWSVTSQARAATFTADSSNVYTLTGDNTVNIATINTCNAANTGRRLTFFCGSYTGQFTDGSNLKLNGNYTCAANGTIEMMCDGTNWLELNRSANG